MLATLQQAQAAQRACDVMLVIGTVRPGVSGRGFARRGAAPRREGHRRQSAAE